MKKIFILLLFIPALTFGQANNVRHTVSGSVVTHLRGGTTLNVPNAAEADTLAVFNIMDYGATSGGTVEDQTAIQAAIEAAHALTGTYPNADYRRGGVVKIPSGIWYITAPIVLRSWVHIDIDRGAIFNFPADYADNVFENDPTEALLGCSVTGGRWYKSSDTYTWLKLLSTATANYVMECSFEDNYVENADLVYDIETQGDGWVNSNNFTNNIAWSVNNWLKTRQSAGSNGLDQNMFSNILIQPDADSEYIIDTLSGDRNVFTNLTIADASLFSVGMVLGEEALLNTIIASGITPAKFINISQTNDYANFVMDDGQIIAGRPIFHADGGTTYMGSDKFDFANGRIHSPYKINIYSSTTYRDTVNKLEISHNGASGTNSAPAGDVGIKFNSRRTSADQATANSSARIISKNSSGTDYGSFLYFQTHGTADNATDYTGEIIMTTTGRLYTSGGVNYVLDNSVGGNDTYTATVLGYVANTGKVMTFHPLTANTDGCTLNINGGGAVAIKTLAGNDLATNDLLSTGYYFICWNGTNWVLMTK